MSVQVTINFSTGEVRVDEPDTAPQPIECLWCRSHYRLVYSISEAAFICFDRDICDARVFLGRPREARGFKLAGQA